MEQDMTPYITLTEAAAMLGVSIKTVRRHIDAGRLNAYRSEARRGTLVAAAEVRDLARVVKAAS